MSDNTPFCNINVHTLTCAHFCYKITKWCIMGWGTGALWDLCNQSILQRSWWRHGTLRHFFGPLCVKSTGDQWILTTKEQYCTVLVFLLPLACTSCWTNSRTFWGRRYCVTLNVTSLWWIMLARRQHGLHRKSTTTFSQYYDDNVNTFK